MLVPFQRRVPAGSQLEVAEFEVEGGTRSLRRRAEQRVTRGAQEAAGAFAILLVARGRAVHSVDLHASGWRWQRRANGSERGAEAVSDRLARFFRPVEAAPGIGVDDHVGADGAVQDAEEDIRRDAFGAARSGVPVGRMRHHCQVTRTLGDGPHRVEAGKARAEQDAGQPCRNDPVEALLQCLERARDVRQIHRPATGGRVGRRHGLGHDRYPLREPGRGLIGQAVVVLDDIDAGACEGGGEARQLGRREADRLDRRAGQGAPRGSGEGPDAPYAEARSG